MQSVFVFYLTGMSIVPSPADIRRLTITSKELKAAAQIFRFRCEKKEFCAEWPGCAELWKHGYDSRCRIGTRDVLVAVHILCPKCNHSDRDIGSETSVDRSPVNNTY